MNPEISVPSWGRVLARREIISICCQIESLPPERWEKCGQPPNDYPGWRMIIKGRSLGADWTGRIDLFTASHVPPQIGDVVYLREMEVEKIVAILPCIRGRRPSYRRVPLGMAGAEEIEVTDGYIRLDPAPGRNPKGRTLRWEVFPWDDRDARVLRPSILWSKEVEGATRKGDRRQVGILLIEKSGRC